MARLSISVDPELLDEVQRLSRAKSKKEALEKVMRAYVQRKRLEELATLGGTGLVEMTHEELARWRASASTEPAR